MVHAVRINNGTANYCNAFVKTNRLEQQKLFGRPTWSKLADYKGMAGVGIVLLEGVKMQMGLVDISAGVGHANTSVAYHAGRLLALHEGDMPYQLHISPEGRVSTLKRLNLGRRWNAPTDNFTAHPKLDSKTGDLHFLSTFIMTPQLKLGTLDSCGNLSYDFQVDMPQNSLVHDMAITQSSKIIFNFPMRFDLAVMVTQNSLPLVFKDEQASHIGLAPHTATSQDQIQWFSLPSFMSFHCVNAWEEGPRGHIVRMYLIAMKRMDMSASNLSDDYNMHMHEVTLDRMKGTANMRKVTSIIGDNPVIHPLLQGQRTKHAWTTIFRPGDVMGVSVGIAKYELTSRAMAANQDACVAQIFYPPGHLGGEANFVPRNVNNPSMACDGEDDGFLMCYVHHAEANTSYLMVFDAKTMSDTPVAKVKLPQRVPYGFHGLFLNQEQLMNMKVV
ncbi:carotenoid oxygenase [Dunaliella salina]|uniref:carotenoid 9,10-dioxygenase n=1 Tax=Dunaliella salina TaxID=3046 RepID=A0ABQ7H4H1_DUNSA|nr:carotenoid oxygenase [Dunaliella salina]|eukprot:KAF5841759.1 carotenoid oxygenase [Dunaliella salina]